MNLSIRVKLISFTFCIVLLVGGSIFLYSIYQGRQRIFTTVENEAREITALISDHIINDLYFLDLRSLRLQLEAVRANPDIKYTYVIDPGGLVLTDGTRENLLRDQKLTDSFSQEMLRSDKWISRFEESLLKVGGPVLTSDGSRIGYFQVGFSLAEADRTFRETTRTSLYITIICLGVGAILAFILSTSFSRPILAIVQAAKAIGAGKLDSRLPVKRTDELGVLAVSTNQMAEALQRRQAETERKNRELQALNAITTATSQSLHLDDFFEIALGKVAEITGRDRVNIRAKDPVTGKVKFVAHQGFSQEEVEELIRRTPHKMSEQVFASGEPLIINGSSDIPPERLLDQSRSVAWIPIKAGTKVVGVLGISDNQSKPFSSSEVELLLAIGNVIGVAMENARLFGETKRNLEGIRALHEIDMAITSTLDLHAVLEVLLEQIDLFLPYSVATVRLFNKKSGLLEPVASRNLDEREWKLEPWKPGRGPANVVFETKAPMMIRNCYNDPRVKDPDFFRRHQLVSYLGVPMVAKEELLGVLSFYTKEEHEFTSEEVEFLTILAGQAAIAIHNARLYEEVGEKIQELQKRTVELERANKVKDEFLSVMSHELRTPLNVVMGYTGMIRDGILGEINAEQEKALEKVISRARDQLTMISSILQAVQLEAGELVVEEQAVGLGDLLNELKLHYDIPSGKEITLIWDYPVDLPVINSDGDKLKHILKNLINNAIKFTSRGSVTISARIIEGSRQKAESSQQEGKGLPTANCLLPTEQGYVEFKVTDTGAGIPEEALPVIFERFRQADSSETRLYGGVGIGLYIVKSFTEMLGGKVEVESEVGKGSAFTVTIPREK